MEENMISIIKNFIKKLRSLFTTPPIVVPEPIVEPVAVVEPVVVPEPIVEPVAVVEPVVVPEPIVEPVAVVEPVVTEPVTTPKPKKTRKKKAV